MWKQKLTNFRHHWRKLISFDSAQNVLNEKKLILSGKYKDHVYDDKLGNHEEDYQQYGWWDGCMAISSVVTTYLSLICDCQMQLSH